MSRTSQRFLLIAITGVSIAFGALVGTSVNRQTAVAAENRSAPHGSSSLAPTAMPASLPLAQAVVAPSFADIAERAIPSIVSIQNTEFVKRSRRQNSTPMGPFEFFFGPQGRREGMEQGEGGDEGGPEEDDRQEQAGSGFIIQADGMILTNYHVVAGASKLTVTLTSGEKYPATLKGKDESIDLALIKIDVPHDLPVLPLGDSEILRTGEWVIAIGNPLGYDHSVTVGVVSGKGRPLNGLNPDRGLANYIQTDAAINFGNSGGPLLNARGEVVGINTAITRNYPGYQSGIVQGIGFALPIDHAKAVLDQLMTTGKVSRGYLSIQIEGVDENKQKFFGLPDRKGAFVQKVNEDGPAAIAGVRNEDIIRSVDGKPVDTTEDLIRTISTHRPGDSVTLGVFRCRDAGAGACDGRDLSLRVKLADRSETIQAEAAQSESDHGEAADEDKPTSLTKLGFTVAELTPNRFRESYAGEAELPKGHPQGVIVTRVASDGPAYEAGIQPRFIITQLGREPITSVADFRKAAEQVKKGQIVRLAVTYYVRSDARDDEIQPESRYIFFEAN